MGPGPALVAVRSTSPWTLRELEQQRVPLVSFDAATGTAYLVARNMMSWRTPLAIFASVSPLTPV